MSVPGLGKCGCGLCRTGIMCLPRPGLKVVHHELGTIIEFEGEPPTSDEVKRVMDKDKPDAVNHPSHYTSHPSGIECIQITQHHDFCTGNAIKYLWRAGLKGDKASLPQDLEKAAWYMRRAYRMATGQRLPSPQQVALVRLVDKLIRISQTASNMGQNVGKLSEGIDTIRGIADEALAIAREVEE